MVKVSWTIEGEKQLSRRLIGLGNSVKNFKPELSKSANFLKSFFGGEVFDTRGRAIGEPWKARKKFYPWPLLERPGSRMRKSFKMKAEKLRAEVWNAVDYFKYHQSRLPRRKLPRRVMMKLTNQLKDKVISFFHEGLWKRVKKK